MPRAEKVSKVERLVPEWSFGDRVRKARQHAKIGANELSEKLGMSKTSVTYWEHGGRPRDLVETSSKIAEITGVDPFWLLTGDSSSRGCLCQTLPCRCGAFDLASKLAIAS